MINNISNSIMQVFRGAWIRDTWHTLDQCDVLLVRHDYNCGYVFQGKAYAHLLDSLGDVCSKKKLKVQSVAAPFSAIIGTRAHFSPVSLNRAYSIIIFYEMITRLVKGADVGALVARSRKVALWCDILDKAKPKIVIGIQPSEYLCNAGKIKKIPVYDLQHGVINDDHPWYGSRYKITKPIDFLPDGFLCWDTRSAATIEKWGNKKDIRAIIIGNPWFLRFFRDDPEDHLVNEAISKGNICDNNRPCILVTLSWGMKDAHPDIFSNKFLIDALERVILDTKYIYNWILRLHPVQILGEERGAALSYLKDTFGAEKAQEWIDFSQIPLPIVLKQADVHITYDSTVTIEASWMGVKSALLNQQICKGDKFGSYYSHERSIGMAKVLPHDPEIIKRWIADTLGEGRAESTFKDSSHSFEDFIDEIITRCNS